MVPTELATRRRVQNCFASRRAGLAGALVGSPDSGCLVRTKLAGWYDGYPCVMLVARLVVIDDVGRDTYRDEEHVTLLRRPIAGSVRECMFASRNHSLFDEEYGDTRQRSTTRLGLFGFHKCCPRQANRWCGITLP